MALQSRFGGAVVPQSRVPQFRWPQSRVEQLRLQQSRSGQSRPEQSRPQSRSRPRVAEGAFLPQSRVAQVPLPQSRVKHRGVGGTFHSWRKCAKNKKTTHATTRHALNIPFLLFAFVILHVFLLRSSSCPSTSQTSFLPVLIPAALLFLIIFSPPASKAVVIVCDARSHFFSSFGSRFFRALPLGNRRQ